MLLLMRCRSAPRNRATEVPAALMQPNMAAGEDESNGDGEKKKMIEGMCLMFFLPSPNHY